MRTNVAVTVVIGWPSTCDLPLIPVDLPLIMNETTVLIFFVRCDQTHCCATNVLGVYSTRVNYAGVSVWPSVCLFMLECATFCG